MTDKVKETLTIKQVIDMLNTNFPAGTVETVKRKPNGGGDQRLIIPRPPFFSAYKGTEAWWICCWDYWVWQENFEVMGQCSQFVSQELGMKCHPCHVHIVYVRSLRDFAKEQKCGVLRFIGKC